MAEKHQFNDSNEYIYSLYLSSLGGELLIDVIMQNSDNCWQVPCVTMALGNLNNHPVLQMPHFTNGVITHEVITHAQYGCRLMNGTKHKGRLHFAISMERLRLGVMCLGEGIELDRSLFTV